MENKAQEDRHGIPPRKRLLTDPKPKESLVTGLPESAVSSDSSSDRCTKKTRELPNLSDCHSCGIRINYTNPNERLQPLDSMWRVVLLCRKCIKRVKSSELCPYCFSVVTDEKDCYRCRDCQNSIHKECVAKYSSGLGFSVCFDCWVPEAVVSSVKVCQRKSRKRNKESCEPQATLPDSKVSVSENKEPNVLGGEVERKIAAAVKASENALMKAVVAKNAVELAKGVLDVVASKKVAGNCETKAVDDAELAFMLHRAINSSPRIPKYACLISSSNVDDEAVTCYSRRRVRKKIDLMNSKSLDVPLICYSRRRRKGCLINSTSSDSPLLCYSRRPVINKACRNFREPCNSKLSLSIDRSVSRSSVGLRASNPCSWKIGTVDDADSSLNGNECEGIDGDKCDMRPDRYLLKYHRIGKGIPRSSVFVKAPDCGSYMDSCNMNTKIMNNTRNYGIGNKRHEIDEERCDASPNRFLLKYQKRSVRPKPVFSGKIENSAPLLPLNCSEEFTTLSDTRFHSSEQALSCANGSSKEQL